MTYLVLPTRIEIIHNNDIYALVEVFDECTAVINIKHVIGVDEWPNVSDAIRKALYMLQLDGVKVQTSSTPHGY